jgi:hypothetical protein
MDDRDCWEADSRPDDEILQDLSETIEKAPSLNTV